MNAVSSFHKVAITGASSLLGREVKQVLEDRKFPASEIALFEEDVAAVGTLTAAAGEPVVIRALDEESFRGMRFVFLAGSVEAAVRDSVVAAGAGASVIDLTQAGPAVADSRPRIPSIESILSAPAAKAAEHAVMRAPSSPAIIACAVCAALQPFAPVRVAFTLFPPVSEHGPAGIEELENQTAQLLSLRPLSQSVFDAQVAFNLLSRYGADSPRTLEATRTQITQDVSAYLAGRVALPALQLIQAPIFYGYVFSAFAEFPAQAVPSPAALRKALASAGIVVSKSDSDAPDIVSFAGESSIQVSRPVADPNIPNAFWLWGGADNVRLAATNAVSIAEALLAE
jgi:aspartate-semialdehyde dehydrogenase